jgi:hypothetical protein
MYTNIGTKSAFNLTLGNKRFELLNFFSIEFTAQPILPIMEVSFIIFFFLTKKKTIKRKNKISILLS